MIKQILFIVCSAIAYVSLIHAQTEKPPLLAKDATTLVPSKISRQEGWIQLRIQGNARDRGYQHGFHLAREISEALRARRVIWEHTSAMTWEWLLDRTSQVMLPKIDPENLQEIDGIVEGMRAAGISSSRNEIVAYNAFLELLWYWWPNERRKEGTDAPLPSKQSCSAFIATGSMTADGGIVLGHNTMLEFTMADANVILEVVPERGHRFVMQTFPGWIHSGTDFFVTDAGLLGAETTIGAFDSFDEKGVPEFVRMRRAMQDATSIDEWCAIMKKGNNGGYANAWLIGDIRSNEIARLELGLKFVKLERTKDGYFTGSNVAEDLRILRFETSRDETDIRLSSVARRERWKQIMKEFKGRIDVKNAKEFEQDHYDTYLRRTAQTGRCLCGHFDADTLTFGAYVPFNPEGSFDAKVIDSRMAKDLRFWARWGRACGEAFDAQHFLQQHPQFDWMEGILKSRGSHPWIESGKQ